MRDGALFPDGHTEETPRGTVELHVRDDGDGKPGRQRVRSDALSSVPFMLGVWVATYVVAKAAHYVARTAYVEATFRDAPYFELGLVIVAAVLLVRAWL